MIGTKVSAVIGTALSPEQEWVIRAAIWKACMDCGELVVTMSEPVELPDLAEVSDERPA